MSLNDTLSIHIELEDGVAGLDVSLLANFIAKLESYLATASNFESPRLFLVADPRPGSIVLQFVCECAQQVPDTYTKVVSETVGIDFLDLADKIGGIGSFVLALVVTPWGALARALGIQRSPPEDDQLSRQIQRLVEALPDPPEVYDLQDAAWGLRARTVTLNYRGWGDVEVLADDPNGFAAAFRSAGAIAKDYGLSLSVSREQNLWRIALGSERGEFVERIPIEGQDARTLPMMVHRMIAEMVPKRPERAQYRRKS